MTLQAILFILGVVLLIAAAVCASVAGWLFLKRDIRGIRDDLTGKKRAKIIAEMDELTPTMRRRQASAPVGTAAAAEASLARKAAQAKDLDDVQITVAPKPKPEEEESSSSAEATTSRPVDDAATVVETADEDTIIDTGNGGDEEEITTVAGVSSPVASDEASTQVPSGLCSFAIVKKVVLADSDDFIRIGRQGEVDA